MSEAYFAFQKRPFLSLPKTETYFPAESIENTRKNVISVLERNAGVPLVFGKNGTGKSLLLKQIGKQFEFDYSVVFIANPCLKTPKSLFQQILYGIQQPYCNLDENELRLILRNYLEQFETPKILLLIDEAQTLGRKVFEELRILLDYYHENSAKIQIVLAGTESFEEKLTHPKLSAFQQHVIARCYLAPFSWSETEDYIIWQMQKVGAEFPEHVFSPEARKLVHKLTDGFPRLINQLGEESLFLAESMQHKIVDENTIREAWGILQQIPVEKMVTENVQLSESPDSTSLEFGELSDESESFEEIDALHDLEVMENVSSSRNELPDEEREETAILKIPNLSYSTHSPKTMPCEDFLQKMRIMEATITQDTAMKSRFETAKEMVSSIPNIPVQNPNFF